MFRRLREMLVQQVPEALSVCEFDCPVTRCTTRTWATCTLREGQQSGVGAVWFGTMQRKRTPSQPVPQVGINRVKFNT